MNYAKYDIENGLYYIKAGIHDILVSVINNKSDYYLESDIPLDLMKELIKYYFNIEFEGNSFIINNTVISINKENKQYVFTYE